MEPTNQDLQAQIHELEAKVDTIIEKIDQARGAWLFAKWLGGVALGFAALSNYIHEWWKQ
jgi:hypothetical protein